MGTPRLVLRFRASAGRKAGSRFMSVWIMLLLHLSLSFSMADVVEELPYS